MLLVGWGGGASRALYALRAGSRKKRKKQHRASAKLAPSRRSAPLLVNNERPPAVLLCGSSASENRARRADRSRSRNFSGLRRAELACLRRFRSACGAFRSACGAETNQAKEPACGGSLLTCLLTRRGSGLEQMAACKSTCCCTAARFAPLSFVPASCWL